jgi:hypothetical protein
LQPAIIRLKDFLDPYLNPPDGGKQKTIPEWLFNVSAEDRENLDSLDEFPLKLDPSADIVPSSPHHGTSLPSLIDRKGKRKASPEALIMTPLQAGQPLPSGLTSYPHEDQFEQGAKSVHLVANPEKILGAERDDISDEAEEENRDGDGHSRKFQGEGDEGPRGATETTTEAAVKRRKVAANGRQNGTRRLDLFEDSLASSQSPGRAGPATQSGLSQENSDLDDNHESEGNEEQQDERVEEQQGEEDETGLLDHLDDDDLSDYSRQKRSDRDGQTTHSIKTSPQDRVAVRLAYHHSELDVEVVEQVSSAEAAAQDASQDTRHLTVSPNKGSAKGQESQSQSQHQTESFDASDPSNEDFSLSRYEKRLDENTRINGGAQAGTVAFVEHVEEKVSVSVSRVTAPTASRSSATNATRHTTKSSTPQPARHAGRTTTPVGSPRPSAMNTVTPARSSDTETKAEAGNNSQQDAHDAYEWPDNFPPPPSPDLPARHRISIGLDPLPVATFATRARRAFTPTVMGTASPGVLVRTVTTEPRLSRPLGLGSSSTDVMNGNGHARPQNDTSEAEHREGRPSEKRSEQKKTTRKQVLVPKLGGFQPDLRVPNGVTAEFMDKACGMIKRGSGGGKSQ